MEKFYFRLEKLSVGYGNKPLISDIEVGLEKGKILTLIGPNGAGKTTILKSITGQLKKIAGTVLLDGKSTDELSGQVLSEKMAVVLTERMKTELLTCRDVVATGRYPYTGRFGILRDVDLRCVDSAMERVHVAEIADRDFREISDGQRQRVMLARAICQEPEILILDEPTSFLDVRHKLEFMSILQQMAVEGMTIVMSLHEIELAQRISDQVVCVRDNRVDRVGSCEEIFSGGYICELYGLAVGSYLDVNGNIELPAVKGTPEAFVIAGGGCGGAVYRKLQRERVPFVTGVLQENDLDYPVALTLAEQVVSVEAFETMGEMEFARAKKWMDECKIVFCPLKCFNKGNEVNRQLRDYAKACNKLVEM